MSEPGGAVAVATLLATAYLCMLGPAQAWLRLADSRIQPQFLRLAASIAWTTCIGLALASVERFSLFNLLAINAFVTAIGFAVTRRRPQRAQQTAGGAAWPGMLIVVAALLAYAPAMETHLAGSDSTTYLAGGIHLASSRRLWIHDDISEALVLPAMRLALFESTAGHTLVGPFARIPGGVVMERFDSDVAWPAFFPAAMVWSAISSDVFGPRLAGAYAPLLAALALWAVWALARRHLSLAASLLATGLVAGNAANLWIARFPMSESLAFFFLWSALLALDTWETDGKAFDAALAGLMFGAASVTRIDCAVVVLAVWTLRTALGAWRPAPAAFYLALGGMLAVAVAEFTFLKGAATLPIQMALWGILYQVRTAPRITLGLASAVAAAVVVVAARLLRGRLWRLLAAMTFAAATAAYLLSKTPVEITQSVTWLSACLGWATLALSLAGTWCFLSRSRPDPAKRFLLLFVWTAVAIVCYNPHSVPVLPLAWRRFAPVVVPGLLLVAVGAVDRAWRASKLLAVCAGAVLVVSVALPSRVLWSRDLYRGTFAQLEALAAWLPPQGTLFVDKSLNATLLGIPLWLEYHRDIVPVVTATPVGCTDISMAAYALDQAGHGPIFLLAPRGNQCEQIVDVSTRRLGEFRLKLALPEQHGERGPRQVDDFTQDLTLDEVVTSWRKAASPAPARE